MSKHLSPDIRVPIEPGNPAILRREDLCIRCGKCRDVCRDQIGVLGYYDLSQTDDVPICIHCGQCANVCPVDSIVETPEWETVRQAVADPDKIVVVNTSPSVRISLGEEFGLPDGSFVQGKMVALLKALGVDYVLDTNFSADMTILEEAAELVERVTLKNRPLPQFTSCCPAWVKFAETYYPELLPHISTAKSPIGMQGPTVKTYFAKKMGLDPRKIVNVALTPCTAKKFEIRREEMGAAGKYLDIPGLRDMDQVITTRELAAWARSAGLDMASMEEQPYDSLMGEASGAGVIFGNTGGVMEAALRTAYHQVTGHNAPADFYDLEPVRGLDGIREAQVRLGDLSLKVAVIYGTEHVRQFLEEKKEKLADYTFIEVMTCPGGCIGGGGQPKGTQQKGQDLLAKRIQGLYQRDAALANRNSHENQELLELYREFYGKPLSPLAEQILHTTYEDRSGMLGEPVTKYQSLRKQESKEEYVEVTKPGDRVRKWKCRVCGYIWEGNEPPAECPLCHKDSSYFDEIKRWRCRICGYECEGVEPPAECPICHKDSSYFDEI
ncbi:MAG: iron hydrogenase small subunit [Acidaminococcus fermentans]|uniref:[FeFe] hydrogenase, group A n=2 Tax=Acidaminococcus fermentans TaxID=905 RepID=UPI0024321F51|nr:[FeFe] hydrogenase, group A [Acidaminococcus fermentans]MCF0139252.1 iron hydrogenase small subunit [Acidaminococcus fermentans]MCI7195638.1 [FeFe] hydrogenase, group A [Acidaminococcus fermentans]